jgi:hypothetical protein
MSRVIADKRGIRTIPLFDSDAGVGVVVGDSRNCTHDVQSLGPDITRIGTFPAD